MPAELGAVLFDMDGTLVDTEGMWWQAASEVALRLGGALTHEDRPEVVGRPIEHTAIHLVRRTRGLVEHTPGQSPGESPGQLLGQSLGRPPSRSTGHSSGAAEGPRAEGPYGEGPRAEGAAEGPPNDGPCGEPVGASEGDRRAADVEAMLTRAFGARIQNGVTILPGAISLLENLRAAEIPTALVSASPRGIVDVVLETVGAHRFHLTVAAEDSARNKPSPDPYLTAAELLGVDASCCVAVEDSPVGLAAARAAGCAVIVVGDVVVGETAPGSDRVVAVRSLETVDVSLLRRLIAGDLVRSNGNNG